MSLFRRVTRYRVSPTQNPQENRLTEVTGAVLERVDGLGRDIMQVIVATAATEANERLLSASNEQEASLWEEQLDRLAVLNDRLLALSEPRLRVETQRTTASGKFVDLELRLQPAIGSAGEKLLFWVEVKHGSGVHGTQLSDYVKDIEHEDADKRLVVVLAPRQTVRMLSGVPETMPVVEWQAVADVVRRWSKRAGLGEVERFLLQDYLAYLHEEGLMDAEVLTAEHAFVLGAYPEAEQTAAKLIEVADSIIQERWGKRDKTAGGKKPAYGPGYWAQYFTGGGDTHVEVWRSSCFEWGMFKDTHRDEPRNAWVFVAGATFWGAKDNPTKFDENAGWLASRRADGFEHVYDWSWRLFRHRYPEELLVATELPQQAELLAEWVLAAFEKLRSNPPPH